MKTQIITFFVFVLLALSSCQSNPGGQIITVLGPIPASEMGITLPHEHILVDFIGADSTGYHRWDKEEVALRALPFLEEIKELGCRTFIECTPAYIGRDPVLLKNLAEKTGLNIITNTGFYGARNNLFIPERAFKMSAKELAAEWIAEFRDGIEDTGIRPGFIKIAVDREDALSPMHEKIIRAAGLTHLETGMVIKSHTGKDKPAFNQLAVLDELGVPASAFIWTHAESGTLEGWIKGAEMGAWISMDKIKSKTIEDHVKILKDIKAAGFLGNVLLSHDSGWYRVGEENGGTYNGYSVLFEELIPKLLEHGFTEEEIHGMMVDNPAIAFSIRKSEKAK